jgi:hypothetical protein
MSSARERMLVATMCPGAGVSNAVATVTSTAVTLYSGQFVAQSELSVVTTFAPVTGWWKVV